jgi:hypothetical protein
VRKLRAIFADIATERPEPLPHVARAGDGSTSSRGRNGDGHADSTLLRGRIRPELAARARRVAREGGITLSAYMTALVTNRPVASTVAHGMSDDFLARVAASPVVRGLDDVERSLSDGACDVAALTTTLRAIVAHIASDSGLTDEPQDEAIPEMFAVRVSSDVADRAKAEAQRCSFPSMVAYLGALIEHPCQNVPAVQPDTLAAGLPYAFAGSRVAAAVANVLRRVKAAKTTFVGSSRSYGRCSAPSPPSMSRGGPTTTGRWMSDTGRGTMSVGARGSSIPTNERQTL